MDAAVREFQEETGHSLRSGPMIDLGEVRLRSGKVVVAWGVAGDLDPGNLSSNKIDMEWPRNSGRMISFPEIDKYRWSTVPEAAILLNQRQVPFLCRLKESLDHRQ
jgi:predicted NUDIX family NTP pyrophosphohydrolase